MANAARAATACTPATRLRCSTACAGPRRAAGSSRKPRCTCYEAGLDGWWLHRWLSEQGIDNLVVDSASSEVNRRARRAKTDRLAGDKLLVTAYCPRQRAIDSAYGSRDGSRSLGSLSATASANPHRKVLSGTVYSDRHSKVFEQRDRAGPSGH